MIIEQVNQLLSQNRSEEALLKIRETISQNPDFYLYHEKLAEVLLSLGRKREAIHSLKKAGALRLDLAHPRNISEPFKTPPTFIPLLFSGKHYTYPIGPHDRIDEGGYRLKGAQKQDAENLPLVSIVTVVYNNPDTLERCIRSVACQDYPNIEHIIIDGGSSSPTLDIIRKFADLLAYYVSEKDAGIYAAMNKGIELSQGSYICILNSDDTYDNSYVSKCVSLAQETASEIIYTNYFHGDQVTNSGPINSGIHFGHLNINHGTFLTHRDCYNRIGPYSESYRIVSDAVWMRSAFDKGIKFSHIPEPLFKFYEGGLSSGGQSAHRDLFISEVVRTYILRYDFLSEEEATSIYLVRFNPDRLTAIKRIAERYRNQVEFLESISSYIIHCLKNRSNFILTGDKIPQRLDLYSEICKTLSIPLSNIRAITKLGCLSTFTSSIDSALKSRKRRSAKTILHFATVFSAPSETFIYDLVVQLENSTNFDNFFLYDYEKLHQERPFEKRIWIPWSDLPSPIRNFLYAYLFNSINPDLVIGHFALNTWKLSKRIKPLKIQAPMLSMTHGIDVAMIKDAGPYQDFVLKNLSRRDNCHFTTVSKFLRQELISCGVPLHKIDLIYNTINPRFQHHRRITRPLESIEVIQILSVGRLIGLKGHRFLIEALRIYKSRNLLSFHLTIVYASGSELLEEIENQIRNCGLSEDVSLIPFVNFDEDPDFYARHDLFIHPSTFSEGQTGRSESFGMSVLEAIAAGLPVITTNAGGIPEVIGNNPGKFAKIVPHGNAEALAKAIEDLVLDRDSFNDNWEFASERLERFSRQTQLASLSAAIFKASPINASLFSSSTLQGAGYAAFRLHRGLYTQNGIVSKIHTTVSHHKNEQGVKVIPHPSGRWERWGAIQKAAHSKQNLTIFTVNVPAVPNASLDRLTENADIINLHWTARFLSIENIAHLTHSDKPVVITVRDMLPITGGCHFFHGCDEWKHSCEDCPQLVDHWENFPARVIEAKRRRYHFPNLTLVALSKHTESILRQAPYFKDCRIEVIPNSIETDVFRPRGKESSRMRLGLPLDRKIIAYVPSYSSRVKGYEEAVQALDEVQRSNPELNPYMLLVGRKTPATDSISLDKFSAGYVADNEELSYIYSAADLVIVPSLEETFSNTTAEAISCGTPVVGFKTGAIPDMVIDGITGYTFEVGDISGFASGIISVLKGHDMSKACRDLALRELQFDIQARRYKKLFSELVAFTRPPDGNAASSLDRFPETTSTVATLLARNSTRRSN